MDKDNNHWQVTVEKDGDDAILSLPPEVIDHLNLKEGDCIEWIELDDGSWEIRKAIYDSDSGLTENM